MGFVRFTFKRKDPDTKPWRTELPVTDAMAEALGAQLMKRDVREVQVGWENEGGTGESVVAYMTQKEE